MEKKKKSKGRTTGLVFSIIGLSVVGLFFVGWTGSNVFVAIRDADYYRCRIKFRSCPGGNDFFTPQGLAYDATRDLLLTSGKMDNTHLASRFYFRDAKENETYCSMFEGEDGTTPICSSVTGITVANDCLYAAYDGQIGLFDLEECLETDQAVKKGTFATSLHVDSLASDGVSLFVGECWKEGSDFPSHSFVNAEGETTHALGVTYTLDTAKPEIAFALPDATYGFLRTPEGEVVTAIRNGDWSTEYRVYAMNQLTEPDGVWNEGEKTVPLYALDRRSLVSSFSGPSGGGDLECVNGRILTLSSATGFDRIKNRFLFYNSVDGLLIEK